MKSLFRSSFSLPLSRSSFQSVSNCSSVGGDYPAFVNYEVMEEEIEREQVEDNEWIKSDAAVRTMRLGRDEPLKFTASEDMHRHIISRGYESAGIHSESSRRVLSSCLTFPLTLSYAHQLLFPAISSKMNVLVVGARAESSLPLVWWKDCLYNNRHLQDVTVEMMGPGLQNPSGGEAAGQFDDANLKIFEWKHLENLFSHVDLSENPAESTHSTPMYPRVTLSKTHLAANRKLLHEAENALKLLQWADVFLLYNPGELCVIYFILYILSSVDERNQTTPYSSQLQRFHHKYFHVPSKRSLSIIL